MRVRTSRGIFTVRIEVIDSLPNDLILGVGCHRAAFNRANLEAMLLHQSGQRLTSSIREPSEDATRHSLVNANIVRNGGRLILARTDAEFEAVSIMASRLATLLPRVEAPTPAPPPPPPAHLRVQMTYPSYNNATNIMHDRVNGGSPISAVVLFAGDLNHFTDAQLLSIRAFSAANPNVPCKLSTHDGTDPPPPGGLSTIAAHPGFYLTP